MPDSCVSDFVQFNDYRNIQAEIVQYSADGHQKRNREV